MLTKDLQLVYNYFKEIHEDVIIIICPRCSTNNPIGSNVCGGCGTPLGDYTLSPNYMPNHRTNKKNNNSALIAVIISLFLVFMILIGVLMYILLRSGNNSNDQNITPNPNIANVATIMGSTTGRMITNINPDYANQSDIDNTTITTTVNIPQPISEPFSIPYSNPQNPKQRFLNSMAEIKNYEYYNLYRASNQTDRNLHARVAFEKWDVLLNEVYAYLKNNMSKSEFKTLDNDELNWIKRKESAISSAAKQYKGTSKETEARYMTGISYTRERCAYLISLIPSQQTPPPPPPTPDVKQKYLNEASAIESYENNIYNATNQTDINLHEIGRAHV